MTEKAVVLSRRTAKTKTGSILAGGAWAAAGLLLSLIHISEPTRH